MLRAASLAGAPCTVAPTGSKPFAVAPGQEFLMAGESIADEDLVPVDGVARDMLVSGSISVEGSSSPRMKYRKSTINVQDILVKDRLFSCHLQELYRRVKKESPSASLPQTYQPIAFMQSMCNVVSGVSTARQGGSVAKIRTETDFRMTGADSCSFTQGEVLLAPHRTMNVHVGRSVVQVSSGTVALIRCTGKVFKVHSLHDSGIGGVAIRSVHTLSTPSNWSLKLSCGEEAMASIAEGVLKHALKDDGAARRRVVWSSPAKHVDILTAETSIVSQANECQLLRAIMSSHQPDDRKLSDRIMKTAACLMMVTFKHGQYQRDMGN